MLLSDARQIIAASGVFTPRNIGELAHKYQLPLCVVCWLLEMEGGVLPPGTYLRIKYGTLTARDIMSATRTQREGKR